MRVGEEHLFYLGLVLGGEALGDGVFEVWVEEEEVDLRAGDVDVLEVLGQGGCDELCEQGGQLMLELQGVVGRGQGRFVGLQKGVD